MEIHHFCPRCGAPDVKISSVAGLDGTYAASCPVCAWTGTGAETLGTVTSMNLWDTDRVLSLLLTNSLTTVGRTVQLLEVIGLLPRMLDAPTTEVPQEKLAKHNQVLSTVRDQVLRASLEAFVVTLIAEAEKANREYEAALGIPRPSLSPPSAEPPS